MKRTALIVFTVLAASAITLAQGRGAPAPPQALEPGASQAEVDKATLAAPANLRNGAMVIKPRSRTKPPQRACKITAFHRTIMSAPFSFGSQPQNRPQD